jgi:hypothetical protein
VRVRVRVRVRVTGVMYGLMAHCPWMVKKNQGPHVLRLRTHKNLAYVLFHAHVQMYKT